MSKAGTSSGLESGSTQEVILSAASAEFAKNGLAGARIDQIARRAGVNKQAIYYYYKSKDGLFRAALKRGYMAFRDAFTALDVSSLPPEEALGALIDKTFDIMGGNQNHIAMISDENMHGGEHLPDLRGEMEEVVEPYLEHLCLILRKGRNSGIFRSDIDPHQVYISIMSECMFVLSNRHTLSALLKRDLSAPAEIAERKDCAKKLIIAGLKRCDGS